jgi:regulator of replication initiation timing
MNEIQINAQFAALAEQRNNAQNTLVNLLGELAVLKAENESLTKQLALATTLVDAQQVDAQEVAESSPDMTGI